MCMGISAKSKTCGMASGPHRLKWHKKWMRHLGIWGIWLFCVFGPNLFAQEISETPPEKQTSRQALRSEAKEGAERRKREIEQAIAYGVDTDLVKLIRNLMRETPRAAREAEDGQIAWIEETPYNQAIVARLEKGYSSSILEAIAIRFFLQQKWLGAETYVTEVLERSAADPDSDVEATLAALSYVRNLKRTASEAVLLELLASETPQIVEQSLHALGQVGSGESAAKIMAILEDEEESFTEFSEREREALRAAGIEALGALPHADAAPYLLAILQDGLDDVPEYSGGEWSAAAQALGELAKLEGASLISAALEPIFAYFDSGNARQRYRAIKALGHFPPQPKAEAIFLQGLQEAFERSRKEAAEIIGRQKLTVAIPSLLYRISRDEAADVRKAAFRALQELGGAGEAAMNEWLRDARVSESRRLEMLQVMLKERDENALGVLRQLLAASAEPAQEKELRISRNELFRIAGSEPWEALGFVYREMLADENRKTRLAALRAIRKERIRALQPDVEQLAGETDDGLTRNTAKTVLSILN